MKKKPKPTTTVWVDMPSGVFEEMCTDLLRARAIAVTLEQQNARALELLEGGQFREVTQEELMEGRYSINDRRRANRVLEAIRVLRGDDAED